MKNPTCWALYTGIYTIQLLSVKILNNEEEEDFLSFHCKPLASPKTFPFEDNSFQLKPVLSWNSPFKQSLQSLEVPQAQISYSTSIDCTYLRGANYNNLSQWNPRPIKKYLEIHKQCNENPRLIKRYLEICNHCNASRDPVESELKYDSMEVFGFFVAFVIWKKHTADGGFFCELLFEEI